MSNKRACTSKAFDKGRFLMLALDPVELLVQRLRRTWAFAIDTLGGAALTQGY